MTEMSWRDPQLFLGIFEAAPDAVVVVDGAGRIILANAQCRAVFGYAPDALLGSPIEVLVPPHLRIGHPSRRDGFAGARQRRPMGLLQLEAVRRDGTVFPAEISLAPVEAGGEHFTSATVRDITGRRREQDRFRSLLEAAPDATVIVDESSRIVLTNDQVANVFGYERGELVGQKIEVLVPERFRGVHPAPPDSFLLGPDAWPADSGGQLYAVRRDGSEFPVEISVSPLDTDEGVLVSAAIRDITERLRLQETNDRVREDLIATVSHELRTPLTSIIGYTELMADLPEEELSPAARRALAVIERNAVRELRLVNDLLTLAFLGQERMPVALSAVDLAMVVRNSVEVARPAARRRGVTVEVDDRRIAAVWGDHQRLGQVVDNLLVNAIKFTPPGGRIELRVLDGGDRAQLEVADTGDGMKQEDLSRIFDRLYRTAAAVKEQVPGAGLGLPIVQAIVEAHGGSVTAESALGEGTVFRVRLPYAASVRPDPD